MHTSLLANPFTHSRHLHLALIYYSGYVVYIKVYLRVPLKPSCTSGNPNPSSRTFRTRSHTSRLISDAFPTIASLSKRTKSLTGIRNTFVCMHVVSYVPNFLWDKQARAAHASWILCGKNLKEVTLISTKICYRSILANDEQPKCMRA